MHVVVIENDAKVKTSDLNSLSLNLIFNIYLKREREGGMMPRLGAVWV